MKNTLLPLILSCLMLACQPAKKESSEEVDSAREATEKIHQDSIDLKSKSDEAQQEFYVPQSTDEQTANNLKNFLKDYAGEDYSSLQDMDKQFQFYKVDLNEDGNEEIFVRLMGPYFCGSGGCTFLLLDKYGEIITKFTVTRAPIFIEKQKVNGWSLLLVKDSGVFKELIFENGSYPSNPSVLPKAPYDAPSGNAMIMFDENFAPCKTYEY